MNAKRKKWRPLRSPDLSNLNLLNFISFDVARACLHELSLWASSWLYSSNVVEKSSLQVIEVAETAQAWFVTTPHWCIYRSLVAAFHQRSPSAQNGMEFGRGLSIIQGHDPVGKVFGGGAWSCGTFTPRRNSVPNFGEPTFISTLLLMHQLR